MLVVHFGKKRKVDLSSKNDLTLGRPPVLNPTLARDSNGMVVIEMCCNHPHPTQEPHLLFHWGANTNTVPLFFIPSPHGHLCILPPEAFMQHLNNLDFAGFAGL